LEIIGVLLIVLIVVAFFKILGVVFHAGVWVLALPFKILGVLIGALVLFAVLIPLGVVGVLASVIMIPLALIVALLPFILVGAGLWLLLRNN